jgi:hypothetical protein
MRYRKTLRLLEEDLQSIEEKYLSEKTDHDKDGDNDFADVMMQRMKKSGMDHEEALKKTRKHNKNENSQETDLDEKKRKSKSGKLTRGYKANRSKSDQSRLKSLTKQYRDADTEAEKMAAIRARDAFEKTQTNTGKKSKHNYKEGLDMSMKLNETDQHMLVSELIDAMADDLLERNKISKKVHDSLKKKAKDRNAPLGALKAIYRKGMGAFYSSGSRSGQNPHSWAMARVNSVLKGGKARSVDKAQWKQIQKHRKKKRKK